MRVRLIAAALFGLALGFGLSFGPSSVSEKNGNVLSVGLGLDQAYAGRGRARRHTRRVARRTARRTARRHAALPHGCPWYAHYGCYYCGGVYYQPIQESGTTVYIIVTP